MRALTSLCGLLLLLSGCTTTPPDGGSRVSEGFIHNGLQRHYTLYLPPGQEGAQERLPLLVALHGGGGDGRKMEKLSQLNRLADRQGIMVLYPDAYERHWNDGRAVVRYTSHRERVDDVGFINRLVERLIARHPVDATRIYVVGASNGGFMTSRLSCETPQRFAAATVVIASLAQNLRDSCRPTVPLPLLMINGTEDPLVPWQGPEVQALGRKLGRMLGVEESFRFWAERFSCDSQRQSSPMDDRDGDDGTHSIRHRYPNCRDGGSVELIEVVGGGHTWPQGRQYLPEMLIGKTARDFNGAEVMWEFMSQYRREIRESGTPER